jgi:hypothetical protein
MHYHIMWGSNTTEEPAVLNFKDREEAISKFMEIVKTVEGADSQPPPWEKRTLDKKTTMFRMISATHKYILVYILVYCDNACYTGEMTQKRYTPTLN